MTKKTKAKNRKEVLGNRKVFTSENGVKMVTGIKYNWEVDFAPFNPRTIDCVRIGSNPNTDDGFWEDETYYMGEDPTIIFDVCHKVVDVGVLIKCNSFEEAEDLVDRMIEAYSGAFEIAPLYLNE